jgi:hypothetical protein
VRQVFTNYIRLTVGSTATTVDVSPVVASGAAFFGAEALNLANLYEEFRLVALELTINPLNNSIADDVTDWAICYRPASQSAPATVAEAIDSYSSCYTNSRLTVPVRWKVNKRQLMSSMLLKWLHVDSTPSVAETATQGRIYYLAQGTHSTSAVLSFVVKSTWEFKSLVSFGSFLSRSLKSLDLGQDSKSEAVLVCTDDYVPDGKEHAVVQSPNPSTVTEEALRRRQLVALRSQLAKKYFFQ